MKSLHKEVFRNLNKLDLYIMNQSYSLPDNPEEMITVPPECTIVDFNEFTQSAIERLES